MRAAASVGTVTLWSHFYYYLSTYSNSVSSISSTINLQTWLLNCELCNTWTHTKKRMAANQHNCSEDIYNLPGLCGRLFLRWMEGTYGNMWAHVLTVAVLCCSSQLNDEFFWRDNIQTTTCTGFTMLCWATVFRLLVFNHAVHTEHSLQGFWPSDITLACWTSDLLL